MNLVKEHVYRLGACFTRSGEDSDRLISVIASLYKSKCRPQRMIDKETFTVIALHQGELDMGSQCIKLKLFGRDGEPFEEESYYESFFNIDLANKVVFWNEKDLDYREPLIRGLVAEG